MLDYLIVTAHPDDETALSGLLLSAKEQGLSTGLICLTQGEAGAFTAVETRKKEMKKAVELLDLDYFRHLSFPDAGVEFSTEAVNILIPLLREAEARIVITIHPDDHHPDHLAVSRLVDRAVFTAGLRKNSPDGKTWHPEQIFYYALDPKINRSKPEIIIDVTAFHEKKLQVIRAHKSQPIEEFIVNGSSYLGILGGVQWGEGLYIRQPLCISDPGQLLKV